MIITRTSAMERANIAYDIVAQKGPVTAQLLQEELMRMMATRDQRGNLDITYVFPADFLEEVINTRETHHIRAYWNKEEKRFVYESRLNAKE